ncbi:hypothetical protein ORI99_00950 [Alishewanella sp. SMS9]|nr:hypothetical protein [Alishewanella sp. SMS9]
MSGYSFYLRTSRYRRIALLAISLLGGAIVLTLPLQGIWYLPAALLLLAFFYLMLQYWAAPGVSGILHIEQDGALHWQQSALPAGQLAANCLLNPWCVQLFWYDEMGQQQRCYLFADQLSASDYRALARRVQLQRWRSVADEAL